jgi:hypothetical protein
MTIVQSTHELLLSGANMSDLVRLVKEQYSGVSYKPAHIEKSAEKMLGNGVLERLLANKMRITPMGQAVLVKLQTEGSKTH